MSSSTTSSLTSSKSLTNTRGQAGRDNDEKAVLTKGRVRKLSPCTIAEESYVRPIKRGRVNKNEGGEEQAGPSGSRSKDLEHHKSSELVTLPRARGEQTVQHSQRNIKHGRLQEPTFVIIDLETTDLIHGSLMPHITQIAVKEKETGVSFSVYVMPKMPITPNATRLTGICVDFKGDMLVNGKRVEYVSAHRALTQLRTWLKQFKNVVLVAHNGKAFDFPILMSALKNNKMVKSFLSSVTGFVDSLEVFRNKYPGRRSYKQVDLARKLLGTTYNEHNAIADVQTLTQLVGLCTTSVLLSFRFSSEDIIND
ncbi:DNA polymerase III subunit epsilon-like [Dreissena polymorpha]|uniref:Exonuclease domain-containing protein n=1 Tax=Dreissena polymorpha TaxID=45954 RepID=A0A9D4CVM1_DREPO|nr:DNA polymerase III subunit epsilon-like [Dreissena polymorpha]KAH3733454.1 hypothetical protein DPMN_039882 [Dreissena polymorpha]